MLNVMEGDLDNFSVLLGKEVGRGRGRWGGGSGVSNYR